MKYLEYEIDETRIYTTVYFVDTVKDADLFLANPGDASLAVKIHPRAKRSDFKELVEKLPHVNRIGFVFDTSRLDNKIFLESKPYFTQSDLREGQSKFSENFTLLKELPERITNIDFLCCNTLKNTNWAKYFELLGTTRTIGASNDQTGNANGNGDWIMETTNEDVKNIYFGSGISAYTGTLISTSKNTDTSKLNPVEIKCNRKLKQEDFDELGTTNYFKVIKPVKIHLVGNININSANKCIVIGSNDVSIIGCKESTIQITASSPSNYYGLIMNGDANTYNQAFNNIHVSNIIIDKSSSTLEAYAGWIGQANYGFGATNNKFTGCVNNADISENSGGIVGAYSTCDIFKCKNNGKINGDYAGGIIGYEALNCNITKCINTSEISYSISGGICSSGISIVFTGCVNTGDINIASGDYESGGICGFGKSVEFIKCVNKGKLTVSNTGYRAGGICGYIEEGKFTKCVNKGDIACSGNGNYVGGMCGYSDYSTVIFTHCVNRGSIDADNSSYIGGICGRGDYSQLTFIKCINKGTIKCDNSSNSIAGILGYAEYSPAKFTECVNYGTINSTDSSYIGGICGYSEYSDIELTKCVNKDIIVCEGSNNVGGILGYNYYATMILTECMNRGTIKCGNSSNYISGMCGYAQYSQFILTKCINKGDIQAGGCEYISGMCGYVTNTQLTLTKCINKGDIQADIDIDSNYMGGFCGYATDSNLEFLKCTNEGNINVNSAEYIAGIAGRIIESTSKYIECTNNGDITCHNSINIGGFIGYDEDPYAPSEFTKCVNNGHINVTGLDEDLINIGGICGYTEGSNMARSRNNGCIKISVSTTSSNNLSFIGGLFGEASNTTIDKCINKGSIKAMNISGSVTVKNIAGFCGRSSNTSINNSINSGNIKLGDTSVGCAGFIGGDDSSQSSITNSYNTGKIMRGTTPGPNSNAAFIGNVSNTQNMSVLNCYSTYKPLVNDLSLPAVNVLISNSGSSKHRGKWEDKKAHKYLLDGWVKSENEPWKIE